MFDMPFTWDPMKEAGNRRKHGVGFEEAKSTFFDENARRIHDPDHSDEEDRYLLLGISNRLRLLVVSYTYRKNDQLIRIISARKAIKYEQEQYTRFRRQP
jgi:uncharacterized protein